MGMRFPKYGLYGIPKDKDGKPAWSGKPGSERLSCSPDLWPFFWATFPLPLRSFFCSLQFGWFAIAAGSYYFLNPLYGEGLGQAKVLSTLS